jgi:hypothetical protein
MAQEVRDALLERVHVVLVDLILGYAAVVFQGSGRGDYDDGVRLELRDAALDIEEFFRAQISAEARLCDGVVAQLERQPRRYNGVAAVGDIGEGAAVDERGRALQRLHQIGLESVL